MPNDGKQFILRLAGLDQLREDDQVPSAVGERIDLIALHQVDGHTIDIVFLADMVHTLAQSFRRFLLVRFMSVHIAVVDGLLDDRVQRQVRVLEILAG